MVDGGLVRRRLSKIEKAGEGVVDRLFGLCVDSDLSYGQMAEVLNREFGLVGSGRVSKSNVVYFFRSNRKLLEEFVGERKSLGEVRAGLFLDYNSVLVKDLRLLDDLVGEVVGSDFLGVDKRARLVGDLLDKKGRLLLRHGRLSGGVKGSKGGVSVDRLQVNVFEQVSEEKSELLKRLKKADFSDGGG